MGIVVPRETSPWMGFRRRMEQKWNHEWEMKTSMTITRSLWSHYDLPVDEKLAYDLDFRVRSILHRLEVEELLKPLLRQIPWEELAAYPQSFAFEACDRREAVIQGIQSLLRQPSP